MTIHLEWFLRASSEGEDGALKETDAGVEVDAPHVGQVGAWGDGEPVHLLVPVALAGDDGEVARGFAPAFSLRHQCQFAQGEPVYDGDGECAHSALQTHVEDRPVHIVPVGVGTVENDHFPVCLCASFHELEHRHIVGVEPQSHVLNVHHEHVEPLHVLVLGAVLPPVVEAQDGKPRLLVGGTAHVRPCIRRAAETVFGSYEGGHFHAFCQKHVENVRPLAVHPRVVAEEAHLLPFQERQVEFLPLISQLDGAVVPAGRHCTLYAPAYQKGGEE